MNPVKKHPRRIRIISFLDIGTNAARMTIVKFNGRGTFKLLAEKRVPTRLGENMSARKRLAPDAGRRAVRACRQLVRLSRKAGACKIIAVATAAAREASNRKSFLRTIERETGVKPVILSAGREARLIYRAAASRFKSGRRRILVLEIGGGTTELAWGCGRECRQVAILKLGAVRLKTLYPMIASRRGMALGAYEDMVAGLKAGIKKKLAGIARHPFAAVYGGAGTILNLADIASRLFRGRKLAASDSISFKEIREIIRWLCSLPLARRRKVPGLNPDRADIILGGAAILEAIMSSLKIKSIRASFKGLRDGLILTRISHRRNQPVRNPLLPQGIAAKVSARC